MKVLMTGGAGLVGSSMCGRLLAGGAELFCVDNLTLGTKRHIEPFKTNARFHFEQWDVSERGWHTRLKGHTFDLVVHLAASSDISLGHRQPEMDCNRTFATTLETLLTARALDIPNFIFSSTSAVYGADPVVPTPENSTRMHPVSVYGAGKLASEAFISAFAENYGLNAWVYRFGNVVGEKLTHGVIYDFVRKLKVNPDELEVLGNGTQSKTYIDVEDCVGGMLHAFENSPARGSHAERFQVFNLSTDGQTSVREIAEETVRVVTGGKATIRYGSSAIGWVGDVPTTSLDTSRMKALGWTPKLDSRTAVFEAIRAHHAW
jgi:UDP-glucose 4-epimerase